MFNSKKRPAPSINEPTITSLEIAKLSGKPHSDLLKSIRKQEVAWEKINEGNFSLVEYKDAKGEMRPMYELTKLESLYIISKYDDEVRAKLVKRWYDLENNKIITEQPRKTKDGIIRLPYNEDEKDVLAWIRDNLVYGDYIKIAKNTGYSDASVNLVLNRKHVNEIIVKEAYRIAIDNKIQGKGKAVNVYSPAFINDALQTIKNLED